MNASGTLAYAQEGWQQVTIPRVRAKFLLPVAPIVTDTLLTTMYNGSVDSLLGIQVHVFDSASFNANDEFLVQALGDNGGDTLRAIAQLTVFVTHAELTALKDTTVNNRRCLEIGLEYPELQSNIPTLMAMRYFILGSRFLCFTITGSKDDLPRFLSYKEQFFNAISFY